MSIKNRESGIGNRGWGLRIGAALVVTAALAATVGAEVPSTPTRAPSLTLPDLRGTPVALDSLKGKVVLVDIWASWCIPCRAAFPAYDELYRTYKSKGFEALAVNVDEKRSAADAFLEGREFTLRVLVDPKGVAPASFKLRAMPTTYLVDKHGTVRFSHEGFDQKSLERFRHEIESLLAEP